jgi:Cdc6-like AAA superfamily ATPase
MINESKIKTIQDKIKAAILKIEAEENIKIDFGTISYNKAFYTSKITVKTLEKTEDVSDVYKTICRRLGFTQNIIGMRFHGTNGIYEIVDIKTKNRTYPIIAKSLTSDKMYKYSVAQIKNLIGGDKIINRNANLNKLIGE